MDIDQYYAELEAFATNALQAGCAVHEMIDKRMASDQTAIDCAVFRQSMLSAGDTQALSPYLDIGFFLDPSPTRRIAWYAFSNDVARIVQERSTRAACDRYDRTQPLFTGVPRLFESIRKREGNGSPDFELIDERAIQCVDDTEVYWVGQQYAKLSPYLAPRIPALARQFFPDAPRFVRLDPHSVFSAKPPISLLEAALVPADPRWLHHLTLRPGQPTYASYVLRPGEFSPGSLEYWDYHVSEVRHLEVKAERRETDYLSMMIEELPRDDDASGLMIGRCIHLDTRAAYGTALGDARLQHLDLAINVYEGGTRKRRMDNTLQHGKSEEASYRTHLYRIEDVPMAALFVFAGLFLRSKSLLSEWMSDMLSTPKV